MKIIFKKVPKEAMLRIGRATNSSSTHSVVIKSYDLENEANDGYYGNSGHYDSSDFTLTLPEEKFRYIMAERGYDHDLRYA